MLEQATLLLDGARTFYASPPPICTVFASGSQRSYGPLALRDKKVAVEPEER
jgi:hypothetical protein